MRVLFAIWPIEKATPPKQMSSKRALYALAIIECYTALAFYFQNQRQKYYHICHWLQTRNE